MAGILELAMRKTQVVQSLRFFTKKESHVYQRRISLVDIILFLKNPNEGVISLSILLYQAKAFRVENGQVIDEDTNRPLEEIIKEEYPEGSLVKVELYTLEEGK
jgi:hypothetical protein